jgi:large repetitive protein
MQYSQAISASGGVAPYSFSVTAGTLPPRLTLSPQGVLSGILGVEGTYMFTIRATDSSNPARSVTQAYTLTIAPQITVSLEPAQLADGSTCAEYNQMISASGGVAPYIFSVTAGALPPGLRLVGQGVLTEQVVLAGVPKIAGPYQFTVQATDSASPSHSGFITYTGSIATCPTTGPTTGSTTGPTTGQF